MNNYPHPIITRKGWPLQAIAFSLFAAAAAAAVYSAVSVIKSILTTVYERMDVDLSPDESPKAIIHDKISASEMILVGF